MRLSGVAKQGYTVLYGKSRLGSLFKQCRKREVYVMLRLSRRPKRTAFTLIELLVVVSIIALLVSILIPSLNTSREIAKRVVCASNQHQIGLGLLLYAESNNSYLPEAYQNPDTVWWYHRTIEAVAAQMGMFNEQETKYGPYGFDLTPRYGAVFACPSSKEDPSPVYGYPRWYHADIANTSYFLVTLNSSYDVATFRAGHYDWQVEPRERITQTDSVLDPSIPLADFILADSLTWRFAYLLSYPSPYWIGNHLPRWVTPDDSGDPDNVDAGSNNLGLDGHVEWHNSADLKIFAMSPSAEEHWH